MNKETIIVDSTYFKDIEAYIAIDAEIKKLEKIKAEIKAKFINTLYLLDYDPSVKYKIGQLEFTARQETQLDQLATFQAFRSAVKRNRLFPNAVVFKPGKDKQLAESMGLLVTNWSSPVCSIKKAA